MKVIVARVVEQHRYLSHERIHFNAKFHACHLHTRRSYPDGLPLEGECFSFLDFVFVPLRSAQQLRADQELESYIKWVHLNSFDRLALL